MSRSQLTRELVLCVLRGDDASRAPLADILEESGRTGPAEEVRRGDKIAVRRERRSGINKWTASVGEFKLADGAILKEFADGQTA